MEVNPNFFMTKSYYSMSYLFYVLTTCTGWYPCKGEEGGGGGGGRGRENHIGFSRGAPTLLTAG